MPNALDLSRPWLHVLTDPGLSRGRPHREIVIQALAGGADAIQFRDKTVAVERREELARPLLELTRGEGRLFVVNDHLDLARALDADGLHLGPEDMAVGEARGEWPHPKILGASARSPERASSVSSQGADYLGVGPVSTTRSKRGLPSPIGLEGMARVVRSVSLPVIAIGGIDATNAAAAIEAGAQGVAVISAIVAADDVEQAARVIRRALDSAWKGRSRDSLAGRRGGC